MQAPKRRLATGGASEFDLTAKWVNRVNNKNIASRLEPVCAELIGSDTCSIPAGITARGNTPILALCQKLIEAGCDPGRGLNVYRGDVLALRVRSIGEAAGLEINSKGSGFIKRRVPVRIAPPIAQNGQEATEDTFQPIGEIVARVLERISPHRKQDGGRQ
jgi:hypothetical protein